MTIATLIGRSLRFYWRTHLGVVLGTALAGGILTGALVVGDSERYTLERIARARLGQTASALTSPEHFFRAQLADELQHDLQATVAPAILLRGSVSLPDGSARANGVQVLGVDERFWKLGGTTNVFEKADNDVLLLNDRLAARLAVRPGDSLVVRVEQPALISRDAPLSGRSDTSIAIRGQVRATVDESAFGRFSLQANQVPPLTVFLRLSALQEWLKHAGQANLLLTSAETNLNSALAARWAFADAGLEVRELPQSGHVELRTDRVFLEPAIATIALPLSSNAEPVLTYFVNEFRLDGRTTPYSFVTATGAQHPDDEMVINSWLAEDLGAKAGDELALRYYVIGERRELIEQSAKFRVGAIIPLEADSSWMPPFPGLAEVGNCREWEPGIPIDTGKIRPKDEDYWNKYRGTPKAFVTLAAGQRLWSNRFGRLTAIRYPAGTPVQPALRRALDPAGLGLFFVPVRQQSLRASRESLDFGQLFLGFSSFLIIAALLLTAMLFVFNLEQRHEEVGLLRALGFPPRQVWRLLMLEGFSLAVLGTLIGLPAGAFYTKLTLLGLSTVWRKAVGVSAFHYYAKPFTLLLGMGLTLVTACLAIWLAQRRQTRHAPAELLGRGAELEFSIAKGKVALALGGLTALGSIGVLLAAGPAKNPEAFFGAGALLLLAGIAFSHRWLAAMTQTEQSAKSLASIGRRNAARRRGRSLTTIAVLASGVFLVVAVNAFHQDATRKAGEHASGTGGFTLYAETTSPIYDDLNTAQGRELFGLEESTMKGVKILPLRVREGDDASCLNLNRALQPRLLGVQTEALERRKAFTFTSAGGTWKLLEQTISDGAVPAIGDEQTVTWALGKKLGDTLPYTDARGKTSTIRIVGVLANSILQGSLLISEDNFIRLFPGAGGYRAFLIDAPSDKTEEIAQALSRGLQNQGLEAVPAWRRLAEFLQVENTYLAIFQALGGLGLLLGSLGLAIVVLRNVLERRAELALFQAMGFPRGSLRRFVVGEHWLLVLLGVLTGLVAALVALLPALRSPGNELPVVWLSVVLSGLAAGGMFWSWLAAWTAIRGPLLPALRNE